MDHLHPAAVLVFALSGIYGVHGVYFINMNAVGIDHYIMGGLALLLCFACVLMCVVTPVVTVFSKDEVRLIYITGRQRWAKWIDVAISIESVRGSKGTVHNYRIEPMEGKGGFLSDGMVPKSIAAKILIHRYWKDEIIGEWRWYKVKRWFHEKFGKKEKQKGRREKRKNKR